MQPASAVHGTRLPLPCLPGVQLTAAIAVGVLMQLPDVACQPRRSRLVLSLPPFRSPFPATSFEAHPRLR